LKDQYIRPISISPNTYLNSLTGQKVAVVFSLIMHSSLFTVGKPRTVERKATSVWICAWGLPKTASFLHMLALGKGGRKIAIEKRSVCRLKIPVCMRHINDVEVIVSDGGYLLERLFKVEIIAAF
jgi:hypothetical protein